MPDTIRCDDCGHENPPDRETCERCNFPLRGKPVAEAQPATPAESRAPQEPAPVPAAAARPLPFRPLRRPPRPPASQQATTLWLVFGAFAAIVVLFTAIQANMQRATQAPVEGARDDQQKRADQFREALAKDSTNVDARIGLADVLYDTGNWSEAIVHYSSALARDSSRVTALVDLGVCYYNLARPDRAEELFQQALKRDPHHPVALFNLGIVNEGREKYDLAIQYFHRALESGPPEAMQQPLMEAMQRVLQKSGKSAPPIPGGS